MRVEESNIIAVLLDVKEKKDIEVDEMLIKQCYLLQKKFQFDPKRNTVDKMQDLIEKALNKEVGE